MARYITTTLPYVNDVPHIGHALEFLQADVLARTWRLNGEDVFFSTGTDEHGQKIFQAAEKAGEDIQAYVDRNAAEFERLKSALSISNDAFIRTTDPKHIEAAQEIWKRCADAGDIYKKAYTGLYCVGCEAFKTEHELTEDKHCVLHPNLVPQEITEENYFFRFSKYQDALVTYLEGDQVIIPEWRRTEALNFVQGGLEDFSISREAAKLSWGIPVPGDDSQVMYVWFDALTSYISTLGWPADAEGQFHMYWEEGRTLQMAGKDQVRFQSLMWQAMLMSANIKNTDQVFYHGFINSGGVKMSKSLGNVISPLELVDKYGTEATRYLLLRHVHPVEDTDITWERLGEWYTANLVNGLGNLVARVMKLAETHLTADSKMNLFAQYSSAEKYLTAFEFNKALDEIWERIGMVDERIQNEKPFNTVKEDLEKGKEQIQILVNEVHRIAYELAPYMPETSEEIIASLRENKKPENLFPRLA
ncbi:MAG: metG [Parcubacteria group bacterium]|nr:metG [Parcubacteria group bacterium]